MAVTTTKTNKPLNPRGNDQSPLKYNRAELYTGKALDFDGVNDTLTATGSNALSFSQITMSAYFKFDNLGATQVIFAKRKNVAGYWSAAFVMSSSGELDFRTTTGTTEQKAVYSDFVTGEYYHAVGIKDDSNNYLYINGQLVDTTASGAIDNTTDYNFVLGNNATGQYYYNGQISNAKVFDVALTAAQVADLYNNPEKIVPTGVADSALKLWLPMQEGAGTTAINGAPDALGSEMIINGDFSDGSSNWNPNPRVTISGGKATYDDAGTGNFNQTISGGFDTSTDYILTFDISDASTYANLWIGNASGSDSYTNSGSYENYVNGHHAVLLKGSNIGASDVTLGFWISTGGSTFSIDNISLKEVANCGTISGATWTHGIGSPVAQTSVIDWNKWKLEGGSSTNEYLIPQGLTAGRDLLGNLFENVRKQGALNLDGNSWADVHDNASLDITPNITLEAWIKCGDELNAVYDHIFVKPTSTTWTSPYGTYVLRLRENDVQWWFESVTNAKSYSVSLSGWNHLAVTKEGASEILYINGAQVDTKTGSATMSATIYDLLIGTRTQYATNEMIANQLAQPRIYNRALTAEEVERNYNAGKNIYK